MARIGVITGLVREASCFGVFPYENQPLIRVSGTRSGSAEKASRELLAEGCDGLLSFGVCGGLDPELAPGTIIIAPRVVDTDGAAYATDQAWLKSLTASIYARCPFVTAPVLGSEYVIASPAAKKDLFAKTGAAAVDMESHEVAAVAQEAGIPFLAVRAVADSARRSVPSAALYGISEDGETRVDALFVALMMKPWQVPALLRLAFDSYAAQSALRRIAAVTNPRFALR